MEGNTKYFLAGRVEYFTKPHFPMYQNLKRIYHNCMFIFSPKLNGFVSQLQKYSQKKNFY